MRLILNLSLFLFALFMIDDASIALTDYQIKKICKNEKRQFTCVKNKKEQRFHLQKGNLIKIPVIPYRK